jgi:predicted HTH transcriptional regulator
VPSTLISEAQILQRLKVEEDSFVERKSFGDWKKDAVKTCVAFANSCPLDGPPGLLCIGVRNDGSIEAAKEDLDTIQKTFERELAKAYPTIPHHTRIVSGVEGKFLAVIVPGSSNGPHFSGPSYIRLGSQTVRASEEQFQKLIDQRERKVREILKWQNKTVKLVRIWAAPNNMSGRIAGSSDVIVVDCDSFAVKLKIAASSQSFAISLEHVVLGYDALTGRLAIEAPQD